MKKANPQAVGGFVLGAVALAIVAVVIFGSGRFFEERKTLVAFFPGSLQGLRVGAPVEMRGVQVGTVTDIWIEFEPDNLKFRLPVVMELDVTRIRVPGEDEDFEEDTDYSDVLIARGLRGQLAAQSFVTGQQSIQVDFFPGSPITLESSDLPYTELPTVPSKIEELESSVGDVVDRAGIVLAQVSDLLSSGNRAAFGEILTNLANVTSEMEAAVVEVRETVESLNLLSKRADGILADNENAFGEAIVGLRDAEAKLSETALSANAMIEENRKGMKDFTTRGLYEFTNLAVDAQAAMEQFRRVMEEIERNPARFFLGEGGQVEVE